MYKSDYDLEIQLSIMPLKIMGRTEQNLERKESLKYKSKTCTVKQVYLRRATTLNIIFITSEDSNILIYFNSQHFERTCHEVVLRNLAHVE